MYMAPSSDGLYKILPSPFIVKLDTPVMLMTVSPSGGWGRQCLPSVKIRLVPNMLA